MKLIRKLYKTGLYSQYKLGEIYNTSRGNIQTILNNKIWRIE